MKLYSGADPVFDEKDIFRLTVPLNQDYSPETGLVTTGKTTPKTTLKTTLKTTEKTTEKTAEEQLREILTVSPSTSMSALAVKLHMTEDGIYYHINRLKKAGRLRRVGGRKSGHWEFMGNVAKPGMAESNPA